LTLTEFREFELVGRRLLHGAGSVTCATIWTDPEPPLRECADRSLALRVQPGKSQPELAAMVSEATNNDERQFTDREQVDPRRLPVSGIRSGAADLGWTNGHAGSVR
jgi:hypothetical protein